MAAFVSSGLGIVRGSNFGTSLFCRTPVFRKSGLPREVRRLVRHAGGTTSRRMPRRTSPSMFVDPWSVSSDTLDVIAAQFFAASLAPYLVFLYFLERPQNGTPRLAAFGFRFLLVFVFATIPAGIYAKVHYGEILANVDWLHGSAESFLTLTNLFVTLGMRGANWPWEGGEERPPSKPSLKIRSSEVAGVLALLAGLLALSPLASHVEPGNALSLPTWVIHVSSLIEWLVAMSLVWNYAEKSGNPRWKGLTWGMLPLHTSGLCACTYHLLYNAPSFNLLVAVQAALTCLGNATMAYAAYRIASYPVGAEKFAPDNVNVSKEEGDFSFVAKLFAWSTIASVVVKWGSLYVDPVFDPTPTFAVSLIAIPTCLNILKWAVRSRGSDSYLGRIL